MTANSNPDFEEVVEEEIWVEVPPRPTRAAPPAPEHPSLVDLVQKALADARTVVEAQIELTKIKAKAAASRAAGAIIAFVAALVLVFYFLWWTFHTIEVALNYAVPAWAASLITWGIILLLILIFAAIGAALVKRAKRLAPDPKAEVESDINAVKEGLGK